MHQHRCRQQVQPERHIGAARHPRRIAAVEPHGQREYRNPAQQKQKRHEIDADHAERRPEQAAAGTDWPAIPSTGLGPDGSLDSPFLPPASIGDYAARITGLYAADLASANAAREDAGTLKTSLSSRFATQSGVDIDAELARMVALQNAYAANARVLSTVQNAWDALLGAVR